MRKKGWGILGKESRDLNDHRESAKQRYQRREFQAEGIADARTLGCRINLKDLRSRKKKTACGHIII